MPGNFGVFFGQCSHSSHGGKWVALEKETRATLRCERYLLFLLLCDKRGFFVGEPGNNLFGRILRESDDNERESKKFFLVLIVLSYIFYELYIAVLRNILRVY